MKKTRNINKNNQQEISELNKFLKKWKKVYTKNIQKKI